MFLSYMENVSSAQRQQKLAMGNLTIHKNIYVSTFRIQPIIFLWLAFSN